MLRVYVCVFFLLLFLFASLCTRMTFKKLWEGLRSGSFTITLILRRTRMHSLLSSSERVSGKGITLITATITLLGSILCKAAQCIASRSHVKARKLKSLWHTFTIRVTATDFCQWFKVGNGPWYEVAVTSRLPKKISLFCKRPYKRDHFLQKRPIRSLLIIGTP